MQYDVTVCTIHSDSDIKRELLRLKSEGCDMILCDIISQHNAEDLGLNSMLITSGEKSVSAAFDEAVRLVRAQSSLLYQNELYRRFFAQEGEEFLAFTLGGQLQYSSLPESQATAPLLEMLRSRLPGPEDFPFQAEWDWEGRALLVWGQAVPTAQGPALALRIRRNERSFLNQEKGIFLLSRSDLQGGDLQLAPGPICVGELGAAIAACAAAPFPVLILGEEGTGKDRVAVQLYKSGNTRQTSLVTLDCQAICEKRWNRLLTSENSPFLRPGLTFYIKSVNFLSAQQAEALFQYIENTRLDRRARLLFSGLLSGAHTENDYACRYLKGHFSTLLLRLPPLRQRREDIPNLLALYLNQLNISLGKQVAGFTANALRLMQEFDWPGNLTQLNRVARTLIVQSNAPYITEERVARLLAEEGPDCPPPAQPGRATVNLRQSLADIQYDIIRLVLQEEKGNQSRTAARLGIGRSTLWSTLKKHS